MTRRQWLLSALIVWHVTAVLIQALPDPGALPVFGPARPGRGWTGVVTAATDAVAAAWVPGAHFLGRAMHPLRPPFDVYIRMTWQLQTWAMFSNPPRVDEYLRVRYYVRQKEGRL